MNRLLILLAISCSGAAPRRTTSSEAPRAIVTARALDHRGDLAAARDELTRALAGVRDDRVATAEILAELARLEGNVAFATNAGFREGLAKAREAQQAARAAGARRALAVATDAEGMLRYAPMLWAGATDYTEPRAVFERAVIAFRDAGDSVGSAQSTFHVGLTFEQAGDPARAAEYYRRALEVGDDGVALFVERHLAGIAEERGDLATARRGFTRSLALREQLGYTRLVPAAIIALANIDLKENSVDTAVTSYRRALALATQLGQPVGVMWAHLALAGGLEKSHARDEALAHYKQALALAETTQVTIGVAAAKAAVERHLTVTPGSI